MVVVCWDETMRLNMSTHDMLPAEGNSSGVLNVFTGTKALPEQEHDLLQARKIGEKVYTNYITHQILQVPSVSEPVIRRKKLLTMAMTKTKISQKEKEEKDINKLLRRRLAWCNQTGQKYDSSEEQYSLLPRALAEADGSLHQGTISKWTEKLQSRYNLPDTTPFSPSVPWIPDVAIIDAMFILDINPLRQHKTLGDYSQFLFRQFVLPHY